MSLPLSDMEWERTDEREPWDGVGSDVLFVATGLCLASLSAASWVLSLAGLGGDRAGRSTDYPDFDL
jgi:hypothetical protein